MSRTFSLASSSLALLVLGVLSSAGCAADGSDGPDLVSPNVEVIDRSTQALSAGVLQWVNGTYSSCATHADGSVWSARISGSTTMDHAAVSVVKNNSACRLVITELMADQLYSAPLLPVDKTFAILTDYQNAASPFLDGSDALAFYGNAKISSLAYTSSPTITILFSDDPAAATGKTNATYATVTSTASESQVVAPDYAATFPGLSITSDFADRVVTESGNVSIASTLQAGQLYVIADGSSIVDGTFEEIDGVFSGGSQVAIAATIAIGSFLTVGDLLPVEKVLIIANTVDGVPAYEVIRITFAPVGG